MTHSPEDESSILKRFAADINQAMYDPESAYSTLADLPVDQELIDLIERFSEASTTVCKADFLTPRILGLPESAITEWGSPNEKLLVPHAQPELSDESLWEADVQVLFTDDTKRKDTLPAYGVHFEGGIEERHDHTPMLLFRLTNTTTGNVLSVRRSDGPEDSKTILPYALFDKAGVHLAYLEEEQVFELLGSLANDRLAVDSTAPTVDSFKQYIHYLGEKFGTTRKEHHLTGQLLAVDDDDDSELYGGVIFAEEETPVDSRRSFVIERLQKCFSDNSDVLYKMRAEYANAPLPKHLKDEPDLPPVRPELEKIICKPAQFHITGLSFDKEERGVSIPLSFGPEEVDILNDTLQQVIASVCDRFTAAQL